MRRVGLRRCGRPTGTLSSSGEVKAAKMNIVVESLVMVLLTMYYWLEAIVLFFIPARFRSKSVKGQVVLITGAGKGAHLALSYT